MLLCQQFYGVIILSNKLISLSGGLLIIFYIYFAYSLFLVWFWQYNHWEIWIKLHHIFPCTINCSGVLPLLTSTSVNPPLPNEKQSQQCLVLSKIHSTDGFFLWKFYFFQMKIGLHILNQHTMSILLREGLRYSSIYFFSPWKKRRLHRPWHRYYCNKLCSSLHSSWESLL